jgi:hypothetical protein
VGSLREFYTGRLKFSLLNKLKCSFFKKQINIHFLPIPSKIKSNMSMKEFISTKASLIVAAMKNNERVERIESQVTNILEGIASGQMVKITRTNIDPELYDELEALGAFEKSKVFNVKPEPKKAQEKKEVAASARDKETATKQKTPSTPLLGSTLKELERKFNENDAKIRVLTKRLDEEDLSDAEKNRLEGECEKLVDLQRAITTKKTRLSAENASPVEESRARSAPPQTPNYVAAKSKKRDLAEAARKAAAVERFFKRTKLDEKTSSTADDAKDNDEESDENRIDDEDASNAEEDLLVE